MILRILKHLSPHKLTQVFHGRLGLLVDVRRHDLHADLGVVLFGFVAAFDRLVREFLRNRSQMGLPHRRLGMILPKHDQTQIDLPLHFLRRRKAPARFRDHARLFRDRMDHFVTGASAARPGNIAIPPGTVLVDVQIAAQPFGRVPLRQARKPSADRLFDDRIVLAMLFAKRTYSCQTSAAPGFGSRRRS